MVEAEAESVNANANASASGRLWGRAGWRPAYYLQTAWQVHEVRGGNEDGLKRAGREREMGIEVKCERVGLIGCAGVKRVTQRARIRLRTNIARRPGASCGKLQVRSGPPA